VEYNVIGQWKLTGIYWKVGEGGKNVERGNENKGERGKMREKLKLKG
jgi:hypothetical protein